MPDIFILKPSSMVQSLTFSFAFECSNVRTIDFVNVMNSYIAIHNNLFGFHLLFTFKHVGCWET